MSEFIDMTGQRYGRLVATGRAGLGKYKESLWECLCDCGHTIITRRQSLISGNTKSCGCLSKEIASKTLTARNISLTGKPSKKRREKNTLTTCTKCGKQYPWSREYFSTPTHSGSECDQPCKVCRKERTDKWAKNHRQLINSRQGKIRRANPEPNRERNKQWSKENPLKRRIINHNRRARVRNSQGILCHSDIDLQYKNQKGYCWWCKAKLNGKYHIDHRIPLSKGGLHDKSNIVISCPHCNDSKGAKLPQEWLGRLL